MNGYVVGELSRALRTASSHEDATARSRADARATAWSEVLKEMSSGQLRIGSRTPLPGLPAWATPEVLRGGFATGRAAAEGPLQPYELQWADRFGLPHSLALLFGGFLSDAGLAELDRLLSDRTYQAEVAEETALLTVAWLLRTGDRPRAFALPTIKDAAYAWRQTLFFLSLAGDGATAAFLQETRTTLDAVSSTQDRVTMLLGGLEDVHHGGSFDASGMSPHGRRLLGWTTPAALADRTRGTAGRSTSAWIRGCRLR